jgi:hypothetical protein
MISHAYAAEDQEMCADAAVVFIWTAVFGRSKWKYSQRTTGTSIWMLDTWQRIWRWLRQASTVGPVMLGLFLMNEAIKS